MARDHELTRPELGYLKHPFAVDRIEDFTAAQIARAAQEPEKYSAALGFKHKIRSALSAAQPRTQRRSHRRGVLRPPP